MFGVPLWSVLTACVAASWFIGDKAMIRGAVALLANWCILTLCASMTGDQYNVPLNMSVDWLTIWVGFAPAKQLPQMLMAISFGIGMMFHADHLFKLCIGVPLEQLKAPYWWRFHYLAWAQAAFMIGWAGHGGGRVFLRNISRSRGVHHIPAESYASRKPVDRP